MARRPPRGEGKAIGRVGPPLGQFTVGADRIEDEGRVYMPNTLVTILSGDGALLEKARGWAAEGRATLAEGGMPGLMPRKPGAPPVGAEDNG